MVRQILISALLGAVALLAVEAALLMRAATGVVAALPEQITLTRNTLAGEIVATRRDLDSQIEAARVDVLSRSERQADRLRADLFKETGAIRDTADRRLGDALARADAALATVGGIREDVRPLIQSTAATERSASALLDTYRALPGLMGQELAPSWAKIQPEITCEFADGRGYGGCWHARITAVLGEAANAGGVFTKKFPAFADSTTGIATDVHTFTSRVVSPRGFWGNFKDLIGTGSGLTRALGAAGLFDQQITIPKQ
ncbi:MAG TPA: hypothetical protein VHW24_02260 [Bryobacteraceae bacterium]|nr:hypothetical protein [Bryobacteraceae bacterium]